jgi:hypothetical protein
MRKILVGVVVFAALVVGWWYASPIWTLRAIRDAAKQRDAAKVSEYVDYPALREDLKTDIRADMEAGIPHPFPLGRGFGIPIAMAVVNSLVDEAVSPQGVETMLDGEKFVKSVPVSAGDDPVVERDGFNTFRVHGKTHMNGALVFHRHGLGWKLAGVDLPADVHVSTG